ncbi:MAG: hypothetical protein ACK5HL_03135 [Bacilli bacterium]
MRHFYIFKISNHFYNLYSKNPEALYDMLNQISKIDKDDYEFAYNLLKEFISEFDVDGILSHLYFVHRNKIINFKNNTLDYFNEAINEKTRVHVTKAQIKISSSENKPMIISDINENNLFVCDFKNKDYFFLENIK